MGDLPSKPEAEPPAAAPAAAPSATADAATQTDPDPEPDPETEPDEEGVRTRAGGRPVPAWEEGEGTRLATCKVGLLVVAYRLKRAVF